MSFKGILFDFDGVVVKSMEQHYEAWRRAFAEEGAHIRKEDFLLMEGQGLEAISAQIASRHQVAAGAVRRALEKKVIYYNEKLKIEFYPYFKTFLQNLVSKNIPLGIVTGGNRPRVMEVVENYFNGEFKTVITSDDVEHCKPAPDPYLKGARQLGLDPGRCLVIENAPLGIKAALSAGMTVIAVTTTLSRDHLSQAHYIASDFREVEQLANQLLA